MNLPPPRVGSPVSAFNDHRKIGLLFVFIHGAEHMRAGIQEAASLPQTQAERQSQDGMSVASGVAGPPIGCGERGKGLIAFDVPFSDSPPHSCPARNTATPAEPGDLPWVLEPLP
jgi:hypothetical protein